jgi:hypothetical protein
MSALFKKLNFKNQSSILVVNAPETLNKDMEEMRTMAAIHTDLSSVAEVEFAIVFVTLQSQIDEWVPVIVPKLKGDAVLWFCYPKGTSKRYKCDFNRDKGWDIMGSVNMEGVRQVAIDEDWSAVRFRNVQYIKSITRSPQMALSREAKQRTTHNKK